MIYRKRIREEMRSHFKFKYILDTLEKEVIKNISYLTCVRYNDMFTYEPVSSEIFKRTFYPVSYVDNGREFFIYYYRKTFIKKLLRQQDLLIAPSIVKYLKSILSEDRDDIISYFPKILNDYDKLNTLFFTSDLSSLVNNYKKLFYPECYKAVGYYKERKLILDNILTAPDELRITLITEKNTPLELFILKGAEMCFYGNLETESLKMDLYLNNEFTETDINVQSVLLKSMNNFNIEIHVINYYSVSYKGVLKIEKGDSILFNEEVHIPRRVSKPILRIKNKKVNEEGIIRRNMEMTPIKIE